MSRQLFWKLCLIFATGVVALFYCINQLTNRTEEGMSMLANEHRQAIIQWGKEAEKLYKTGKLEALSAFVDELKVQENTWVSVISFDYQGVVGDQLSDVYSGEPMFGRSVDWKIHLYLNYWCCGPNDCGLSVVGCMLFGLQRACVVLATFN